MKRIVTVIATIAMSWGATAVVGAQGEAPAPRPGKMSETVKAIGSEERMMPEPVVQLERLTKGLKLNEKQQKQIRPILDEEYARLKEIRWNEDMTPKQIQQKVEALRTATISKVQTYLTPEQREKYVRVSNEIKSNKQQRMKENRRNRIGTKAEPPAQVLH